jgi:hypothetical protein
MDGGPHLESGIPYANIVWESLGLRERGRPRAPEWARGIRSFEELGERFGMVFFTDREEDAARYGEVHILDLDADQVLDVIEDPHTRTHRAWIALLQPGLPLPLKPLPEFAHLP